MRFSLPGGKIRYCLSNASTFLGRSSLPRYTQRADDVGTEIQLLASMLPETDYAEMGGIALRVEGLAEPIGE